MSKKWFCSTKEKQAERKEWKRGLLITKNNIHWTDGS
jgi:hypothetical protein